MSMLTHTWVDQYRRTEWGILTPRLVSEAVQFDCGDVSEALFVNKENYLQAQPPFPTTLLQFTNTSDPLIDHILIIYRTTKETVDITVAARFRKDNQWRTAWPRIITRQGDDFSYHQIGDNNVNENTARTVAAAHVAALQFFYVLGCSNVKIVDTPAPKFLNKKRAKAGKFPIYEHKTLVLELDKEQASSISLGGTHASPRVHLRRGHVRNLPSGKRIWIQPCVVGSGPGMITKDYKVKQGKATAQKTFDKVASHLLNQSNTVVPPQSHF